MDRKRRIRISKYLSKHLRHSPERLGLTLEQGGWVEVDVLLDACARNRFVLDREELEEVVGQCEKQRFSLDDDGARIRANQGHSVEVDLELEAVVPPDVLYHGTPSGVAATILEEGLLKMKRHHVHLSRDVATAEKVGARRGRPVILTVDAAEMHSDGLVFYCSENGVWLVDHVPPRYLRRREP
ncbi:MAG: RNA 2'-phosphotransferase [Planctomycetales bacterium]